MASVLSTNDYVAVSVAARSDTKMRRSAKRAVWLLYMAQDGTPQNHYAPSAAMGITATPSSRV